MKVPTSKRLEEIAKMLEEKGYVKAKELAEKYEVSMETIRKDLTFLEEKGIARKEYGGASLSPLSVEKSMDFRSSKQDVKKQIAKYATTFLKEHHVLLLDAGSTCNLCANYINELQEMDIVTNSLDAFEKLDGKKHNVFLTGGRKRETNRSMIGNWSEMFIKSIHADICFLGTSGIMNSEGPTGHSYQDLSSKQAMIERSDLVFVLADSSKFSQSGFHTVTTWDHIDGIITDHNLSPKLYEKYSKKVPIYIAEEEYDNEEDCED